jgi:hypothetical protein
MVDEQAYGSPQAFRRALTDRLRAAAGMSKWTLPELQRQFAYDRLLARLYASDQGWIIKGAAALLARNLAVRATVDVDVYRHVATEQAEAELRVAVARDLGDWFRFEIGPGTPMTGGAAGVRLPVTAYIGQTSWADFKVDIVGADLRMTGTPEDVPSLAGIGIGDVAQPGYRAYPLVDHIADKIAAMLDRYGPTEAPSTRFKDLVDLFAIVSRSPVAANAQRTALQSEADRRGMILPKRFALEDRARWERGYAAEVKRSILPNTHTLDDALTVVTPFIDPLLDGSATGIWDPEAHEWA